MNTTLPPFLQATSGALGSAVGNALVYPLDVATTRMQNNARRPHYERLNLRDTLSHLLSKKTYISDLYSGIEADTLSTLLSNFIYFYTYTSLQKGVHIWHTRHPVPPSQPISASPAGIGGLSSKASESLPRVTQPNPLEELLIGVISGLVSKGISLPISTICVRQQIENDQDETNLNPNAKSTYNNNNKRSLVDSLRAIYAEQGIEGLFSGFTPTIPLTLLPSLTLYTHSLLIRLILPKRYHKNPPAVVTFLLGALSNALATIPLYPLVLIKVLSQSGRDKGKDAKKIGMLETLVRIIRRGGIRTLYTGLEGQLVKGFVQQGVMMLVKQRIEQGIVKAYASRGRAVTA
ncbi:uncharacterized protein I303_104735 [Kwoniella dejecticola CBS 10117]|uniref:Mitochondrial carrier n=1 Tax=Kwoniella dejecticola CBS 10117 TaxID=1296121 RepID=A0A1A6A4H3_9TREE|nr:uncharacterized protein I303_04285 [Kwoniella dejecticola CBS 10117]OBR84959.1 hypothetical protein I303_04285 [Kwoniella dejecticola CBS 10117]